jgi:hypothetical protein
MRAALTQKHTNLCLLQRPCNIYKQDSLDAAFDVLHRRIRDRIYSTAAAGTAAVASTLSTSEHEQHDFEEPRPALASVVSATKVSNSSYHCIL